MNDDSMRLDGKATHEDYKLLDLAEVSTMLHVHRHTIAKLVKDGDFPSPIVNRPRKKMWSIFQIKKFVENGPNRSKSGESDSTAAS